MSKKQTIKQFLRPSLIKILITIFFVFVSFYFSETQPSKTMPLNPDYHPHYSPENSNDSIWYPPSVPTGLYVFYYCGSPIESISKACTSNGDCVYRVENYFNFVFDLLFWYFSSCLIVFSYNKLRMRNKKSLAKTDL